MKRLSVNYKKTRILIAIPVYIAEDPANLKKKQFSFFFEKPSLCKERLMILTNQMHNEVK